MEVRAVEGLNYCGRGLSPAHEAYLRSVGIPIIEPQLALTIESPVRNHRENLGTPEAMSARSVRAQQLYHLLTQRYGGSASTRELARNHRFKADEVAALAHEFPQLFRLTEIPTIAHGSPRRTLSAVTS
jgi:hypothetical protein